MASYRTSAAGGGTSGSTDRTCAILSAVNDFIIVFAATSGNTNTAPTCSDGSGGTYSLVGTAQWGASANTLSVFVANQLVAGPGTTTVTVATGSNTAGAVVMVAYQGVRLLGLTAVRQFAVQQNQAAAATPAPVFTNSALTTNPTLGCIANTSNPATMTTPSGWTERQDTGQATPNTGNEVVTRDSGFTGTTVTWGSTSGSTWASFILELESTIPHEDDVVPVPVLVTPTTTIAGMSVVEEILAAAAASALEEDIAGPTAPIMTTLAPTWFTVDEFVATAAASAGLDEWAPLAATLPLAAGPPSLLSIDESTIVIGETAVIVPLPAPAPSPPQFVFVPDEQAAAAQAWDDELGVVAIVRLPVIQPPLVLVPDEQPTAAQVTDEEIGLSAMASPPPASPPTFPPADEFVPTSTTPDDELGLSVMPPRAADLVQPPTSIDEPGPVTVDEGVTIVVPPAPVTPIPLVLVTDEQAAAAQAWDDELGVVAIVRPPVIQPPLVLVPDEQPTAAQVTDEEIGSPASSPPAVPATLAAPPVDELAASVPDEELGATPAFPAPVTPPQLVLVPDEQAAAAQAWDDELGVVAIVRPPVIQPPLVLVPDEQPTAAQVTDEEIGPPAPPPPAVPTTPAAPPVDEFAASVPDEELGTQAVALVVALAYCPPALPIDEFSGFVVPPPPPPRPTPTFTGGGGGGGGGYYVTRFSDYVIDDDGNVLMDEPSPDQTRDDVRELEHAERAAAMGDAPMSVPTFVIDLLGPGALSFGTTKRITTFATGKWGKKGGAAAAVGSAVATFLATKKAGKVRLPLVAGSSIASLETLYHLYVSESKRTTPPTRSSMTAFRAAVASQHAPVSAQARQVLMRGKSGRSYPVLVVQYTADIYGGTWFAQEARKMAADGSVDLRGTLLDELTPKR